MTGDAASLYTLTHLKSVEVKQCDWDGQEPLYYAMEFLSDCKLVAVDLRVVSCT